MLNEAAEIDDRMTEISAKVVQITLNEHANAAL